MDCQDLMRRKRERELHASNGSICSARKPEITGTTDEIGYRVQARNAHFNTATPVMLDDGLLGPDWREIHFSKGYNVAGIPDSLFGHKGRHDLLAYETAVALAWTIIAQNPRQGIECRLAQYRLVTSFTLCKQGVLVGQTIKYDLTHKPEVMPND